MKVVVLAKFRDKYTKEICEKGSELEFPEERVNEIMAANDKLIEVCQESELEDNNEADAETKQNPEEDKDTEKKAVGTEKKSRKKTVNN